LKGAGLLDSNLPPGFAVPEPYDSPALTADEDPLEDGPNLDPEPEDISPLAPEEAEDDVEGRHAAGILRQGQGG
jgi:segregation and condensation protein B